MIPTDGSRARLSNGLYSPHPADTNEKGPRLSTGAPGVGCVLSGRPGPSLGLTLGIIGCLLGLTVDGARGLDPGQFVHLLMPPPPSCFGHGSRLGPRPLPCPRLMRFQPFTPAVGCQDPACERSLKAGTLRPPGSLSLPEDAHHDARLRSAPPVPAAACLDYVAGFVGPPRSPHFTR
jgi:hypothetical protein